MKHYTAMTVTALETGDKPEVAENLEWVLREACGNGGWTGETDNELESKSVEAVTCSLPLEALIYVPGTRLVDDRLQDGFAGDVWEALSSSADLTWGDTTHSMTYMKRFYLEMEEALEGADEPELVEWLAWLKEQADAYPDLLVDLES